jgi:hypothetical protein
MDSPIRSPRRSRALPPPGVRALRLEACAAATEPPRPDEARERGDAVDPKPRPRWHAANQTTWQGKLEEVGSRRHPPRGRQPQARRDPLVRGAWDWQGRAEDQALLRLARQPSSCALIPASMKTSRHGACTRYSRMNRRPGVTTSASSTTPGKTTCTPRPAFSPWTCRMPS